MARSRSAEAGVLAKTKETLMHCLFLFCLVKYHKLPLRAPGQPAQFYGETIQLYIITCFGHVLQSTLCVFTFIVELIST